MSDRLKFLALVLATLTPCCAGRVETATEEREPPSRSRQPRPPPEPRDDPGPSALFRGGRPEGLALDPAHVYWADAEAGAVMKVAKTGGPALPIATAQASPSGVAVANGMLYFTNTGDGTVRRVSVDGGPVVTLATSLAGPRSLTIAGDHVYVTTDDWPARVPLSGGETTQLKPTNGGIPLGQGGVQGITSDGGLVYAAPYQVLWPIDGNCDAPSLFGLCTADWYAGPVMRSGALDGTSLFTAWGNFQGAISVTNESGLVWLASDPASPEAIAVDSTRVYWASSGGSVMTVPRSGGSPNALAVEQAHPVAIAVDESFVFWTNEGSDDASGSVNRCELAL